MIFSHLSRLFYTLRHLQARQRGYFILRRLFPPRRVAELESTPQWRQLASMQPLPVAIHYRGETTFCFLNLERELGGSVEQMDWNPADTPRLWRYNLHYFDFLRQSDRPEENKAALIDAWIDANPQGVAVAWEPFTVSLRIVNWCYFIAGRPQYVAREKWLRSLHQQVLWLEKNDEQHILANHYFENLKALLFAACFFSGDDAARWRDRSFREIFQQLREQTLEDGGHYERSPQYHSLMLENYLDIYQLLRCCDAAVPEELIEQVEGVARAGLDWLCDIVFPDKQIPLFNDSAFSVAPDLIELQGYAQRLFAQGYRPPSPLPLLIDKSHSGLYGYRASDDMLLVDCGDIGPSYQPGHSHCDFLSYELMLDGHRIVVDSGVYEYQTGAMRDYVRSTAAHNTVAVDGGDQSEIWGEFRVARRAERHAAGIIKNGGEVVFSGAYSGFYHCRGGVEHARDIRLSLQGEGIQSLQVSDSLAVKSTARRPQRQYQLENFIHFHPDVRVSDCGGGILLLSYGAGRQLQFSIASGCEYRLTQSWYCPEFGVRIANPCLVLSAQTALPQHFSYTIERCI